jgi:hypothetical protein
VRSGAGRRPLSADEARGTPTPDGARDDGNPLAFLAMAASMDDE